MRIDVDFDSLNRPLRANWNQRYSAWCRLGRRISTFLENGLVSVFGNMCNLANGSRFVVFVNLDRRC